MRRSLVQRNAWRVVACGGLLSLFLALGCGDDPRPEPVRSRYTYDKDGYLTVDVDRPADPPNLVILLLDTLRADAVALPGDDWQTYMPYLSKLATQGVSFSNATAPAPWTLPSVASLLTGVMPHEHRVDTMQRPAALSGAYTTFAEVLRNGYGYETLGFPAGPWFDHRSTVWQGFRARRQGFAMRGARPLLQDFVKALDPDQPFFLLLHSFEAHDPYGEENHPFPNVEAAPPPGGYDAAKVTQVKDRAFDFLTSRSKRRALHRAWGDKYVLEVMNYLHRGYAQNPDVELAARLRASYFEGVRWVDKLVEQTVALLNEWKLLDNTLLIVMSDHGEAFGEHGTLEHSHQLYDELVRVPLIMVDFRTDPSKQLFRGGRVFRGSTATIDLLPTFFEYAGLKPLDDIHGRSFLPRIVADDRSGGSPAFSEERLVFNNPVHQANKQLISARSAKWKYILTFDRTAGTVQEELYDLEEDPGETHDLAAGVDLATLKLDDEFCLAVEGVRDAIWGEVAGAARLSNTPYTTTGGDLLDPKGRPAPCGSKAK